MPRSAIDARPTSTSPDPARPRTPRTAVRLAVPLVAALLGAATLPATAAVGAPAAPAATVVTSPVATSPVATTHDSAPRLTWRKPTLSNPTTVYVSSSKRDLVLSSSRDYIIKMPSSALQVKGGLRITGGRNVVLIGGEIRIPWGATASNYGNRGLYLKDQTGTVHVEGLLITGGGLGEGINMDQRKGAVVQLQNIRVDTVKGSQSGHHADIIQTWAGPRVLRIDRLTGATQYQGFFLLPKQFGSQPKPDVFDIRRVDITGTSTSKYMVWRDKLSWPLRLSEVYVKPRDPRQLKNYVYPVGTGQSWSAVKVGAPPSGQFVPAGRAGTGYRSPGYVS